MTRLLSGWLLISVLLTLTACGRLTDAERNNAPKYAALSTGPATPPMPFVSGSTIVGLRGGAPVPLETTPRGGLAGWLAPAVVPSPDGASIAYNAFTYLVPVDPEKSWSQQGIHPGDPIATPSIHLVDLASGSDTVLARGAFSLAWRADGTVAYLQGQSETYNANEPFLGNVVVQSSLGAPPEVWTKAPDRYIVAAWAGSQLLVYRESEGEWLDLLALDGSGHSRLLASGANLVAVSPDASQILVGQNMGVASLLDVASGKTLATLDLSQNDPVTDQPLRYLAYGGSWVGDQIAAEGGPGIVLLRVSGSSISLTDAIALSPNVFSMPPHEPRLSADGETVVSWTPFPAGGRRDYAYLACTIANHSCTQGPVADVDGFYAVYNPSRPIS